jgi:hypothetical protein
VKLFEDMDAVIADEGAHKKRKCFNEDETSDSDESAEL